MKSTLYTFAAVLVLCLAGGCNTEKVANLTGDDGEPGIRQNSYGKFELSNDSFKLTLEKSPGESFRIVAITNLRANVTTVDLRLFGNSVFHHLISSKLQKGGELLPEDEDILYFSMDIWVGTMNDVTTYLAKKMRPDDEYSDIPDDFESMSVFTDINENGLVDQKRIMSAVPREQLRRLRTVCAKNLSSCDTGRVIHNFGSDFWRIPKEVFLYQIASIQGELRNHREKRYLEPSFSNLWGTLKTNDRELQSYYVWDTAVSNRKMAEKELSVAFAEMDAMVAQVRAALAATGDKKSRDILRDVYEEFAQKNDELKGNLDLMLVDIPVAIYAKIALNEIDKAKGLNDSEEDMIAALMKFRARTEYGILVSKIKSQSARDIFSQLVEISRDELGDKEVEKILGRVW